MTVDIIIAFCQLGLCLATIPQLMKGSQDTQAVTPFTSLPVAFFLGTMACAFASIQFYFSAVVLGLSSLLWFFIYLQS